VIFLSLAFCVLGQDDVITESNTTGSCATESGNRCIDPSGLDILPSDSDDADSCKCDILCRFRNDCCDDYVPVCHGACPVNKNNKFLCRDGTECDPLADPEGYGCCIAHGGKWKCPRNSPYMCSGINSRLGAQQALDCGYDHCCMLNAGSCESALDRVILQECPVGINETRSICPSNESPHRLFPDTLFFVGSKTFDDKLKASASMETDITGKRRPSVAVFPTWPYCPHHHEATGMLCVDGTVCDVLENDGWTNCCVENGGRHKCPALAPVMCAAAICSSTKADRCCDTGLTNCEANANGTLSLDKCPTSVADSSVTTTTNEPTTAETATNETATAETTTAAPTTAVTTTSVTTETPAAVEEDRVARIPTRQCSTNFPVLCSDNTCVAKKKDCADGVQTNCPALPWCKAEGEWESTPGGQVAFAHCSSSPEGEFMGRKYRPCILKFVKKGSIPTTETSKSTGPSTASTASTTSTTSAEEGASTGSTTSTTGAEDDASTASTTSTTSAEADVSTASTTSTTSAEDGVSTAITTSTETTTETNQAPEGEVEADSFMEVAQWGDVVDTALFCKPRPPKCSEILTNDGQTILALEVHDSQELRSTKCRDKDGNKTGRTDFDTYSCRLFGGVPSLERVKTCGQRCEDDDYCNGGKADFKLDSVSAVRFCVCDRCPKDQSGTRCEIVKEKDKKSNVVGTVIVVIAFLIIIGLCLGLCGAFKYCEKKKKKDEESQVRLPTPAKGLNSLE